MQFLSIDDEKVLLDEVFNRLKISGNLHLLLGELQKQRCLEKEIQKAGEAVQFDSLELEQYIIDFRVENQLTSPEDFDEWLALNWLSYEDFCQQAIFYLQLQKLTETVTDPLIPEAFLEHQKEFEEVVLSRIVVTNRSLAEQLLDQLLNEQVNFEQLARQHSIAEDAIIGGAMGLVSKDALPDQVSAALTDIAEGQVIGVIDYEDTYCLLKVEKVIPPVLNDEVKEVLRDRLFEIWLAEKMEAIEVIVW
jgi:parvulin-like peptidyl-prolyl isomerase